MISTDFSHYPSYETAVKTDAETAEAIFLNDLTKLQNCCNRNKQPNSKNLLTGLCGAAAVQTLLHLTQNNANISFEKIVYQNSGDVPEGDKSRVVGYWAIAANRSENELNITKADKETLLKLARESISNYLKGNKNTTSKLGLSGFMNQKYGVFVTLKKRVNSVGALVDLIRISRYTEQLMTSQLQQLRTIRDLIPSRPKN